jgi:hypothetical protein
MSYRRIVVSAAAATVGFFVYGFLVHGLLIAKDYHPYPEGVYRAGDEARSHMPFGLAALFVAILVFATREATRPRPAQADGARLGLVLEFSWQERLWLLITRRLRSAGSLRWGWRAAS